MAWLHVQQCTQCPPNYQPWVSCQAHRIYQSAEHWEATVCMFPRAYGLHLKPGWLRWLSRGILWGHPIFPWVWYGRVLSTEESFLSKYPGDTQQLRHCLQNLHLKLLHSPHKRVVQEHSRFWFFPISECENSSKLMKASKTLNMYMFNINLWNPFELYSCNTWTDITLCFFISEGALSLYTQCYQSVKGKIPTA